MKKKLITSIRIALSTLILVSLAVVAIGLMPMETVKADGEAWLDGWDYRGKITINGSVDGDLTNYPVWFDFAQYNDLIGVGSAYPIYFGVQPNACSFNGTTYIAYQGEDEDPYVIAYNETTGEYSDPVQCDENPLTSDAHGAPAIMVDDDGYIHVMSGCHGGAIQYVKSTNPEDISSWDTQTAIGTGITYPKMVKADGTIYLMYRYTAGGAGNQTWWLSNSSNFSNATKIMDWNAHIYLGEIEVDSSNSTIHLVWSIGGGVNPLDDVSHAYYNIGDSHLYSMNGTDLGTMINGNENGDYCRIVTDDHLGYVPRVKLDDDDYPFVFYTNTDEPASYSIRWNGSSWDSPVKIEDVYDHALAFITDADNATAYISDTDNAVSKYSWNGSSWTKNSVIIEAPHFRDNHPRNATRVENYTDELKWIISDADDDDFTNVDLAFYGVDANDTIIGNDTYDNYILTNGYANMDFSDVRFTTSDGETELTYWLEEGLLDTAFSTSFAVNITSILADPAQTTIYYYCGNTTATTTSNGTSTFTSFDDFEWGNDGDNVTDSGGGLDWTWVAGDCQISDDTVGFSGNHELKLVVGADSECSIVSDFDSGYALRLRFRKTSTGTIHVFHGNDSEYAHVRLSADEDVDYYPGCSVTDTTKDCSYNTWELLELNDFDLTAPSYDIILNGILAVNDGDTCDDGYAVDTVNLRTFNNASSYIDDVIVHKWTDNTPVLDGWEWEGEEPLDGDTAPTVTTSAASDLTCNSVTGNGNITSIGSANVTYRGFQYGIGAFTDNVSESGNWGTGVYDLSITGLSDDTEYQYRAFAQNSVGISYGSSVNFTTTASADPTVTTGNATSVGYTTATLHVTLSGLTCDDTSSIIFEWGTATGNYTDDWETVLPYGNESLSHAVTGLTDNTTYYYRVRAMISGGAYQNGDEVEFTTDAIPESSSSSNEFVSALPLLITAILVFTIARIGLSGNITSIEGIIILIVVIYLVFMVITGSTEIIGTMG